MNFWTPTWLGIGSKDDEPGRRTSFDRRFRGRRRRQGRRAREEASRTAAAAATSCRICAAAGITIQTGFVDEPRTAVQQADELVAQAMKHIAETFANERTRLEQQWDRGDDVNTEDLRQALRKYRASSSGCCRSDRRQRGR